MSLDLHVPASSGTVGLFPQLSFFGWFVKQLSAASESSRQHNPRDAQLSGAVSSLSCRGFASVELLNASLHNIIEQLSRLA